MSVDHGAAGHDGGAASACASAPRRRCSARYNIIILSDRMVGPDRIPIPALLATAAVHHHLIRKGLRTSVGLVVETGEAREVHHFACLAGYGAEAINPYLAFETLAAMAKDLPEAASAYEAGQALHQGGRQGPAQGHVQDGHLDLPVLLRRADLRRDRPVARLRRRVFHRHRDPIEGAGLAEIAEETARRHADAFGDSPVLRSALEVGGEYAYRLRGEAHNWTPETVSLLQHAVRGNAQRQVRRLRRAAQRRRPSTC